MAARDVLCIAAGLAAVAAATSASAANSSLDVSSDVATERASTCTIEGKAWLDRGVFVRATQGGAVEIAEFDGGEASVSIRDLPRSADGRRARVRASGDSVRIDGWIDVDEVPIVARRDLSVVGGVVSIAQGAPVRPFVLGVDTLEAELRDDFFRGVRAKARCDELVIGDVQPIEEDAPVGAGLATMANATLSLYGAPDSSELFRLAPRPDAPSILFNTIEEVPGWTHVTARDRLVIDGWVRTRELTDDLSFDTMSGCCGGFGCSSTYTLETVVADTSLRMSASKDGLVIGVALGGGRLRIGEHMDGFTSVEPDDGSLRPPILARWWVASSALLP